MNTESRILLAVLGERGRRASSVSASMTGLLVARSRADEARSIREMMGRTTSTVHLPATLKGD
jgi:hypothetical protein